MLNPIRALWRRLFHPNLPWWVSPSVCSVNFMAAIMGCSKEDAIARRTAVIEWHHERWLAGEKF
jgi:hypothetical protein